MKLILTTLTIVLLCAYVNAQEVTETPLDTLTRRVASIMDEVEKMKRLEISGYVQPQFQYCDSAGAPSVAGGDFNNAGAPYYSRFMMRRGRFKFTYNYDNIQLVVNTDATEKGLNMRETYAKIWDKNRIFSLTAGLLQVQFGFEVTQSSSVRETPERARYNQTLFPVERDLGAFGSIVLPKSSKFYGLKLDVAIMNGVGGVAPEFDSNKDLTGRLQYSRTTKSEKLSWAIGASGYYGGYRVGKVKDYRFQTLSDTMNGFAFASDTGNYNRIAQRIYMASDFQVSYDWPIGITTLRGEYIMGENPGTSSTNKSPSVLPSSAIYHRSFSGAYFYYIQNVGQTKFQVVAKYDWFDPNVKVAGKEIGKPGSNTTLGDIRFDTFGFGVTYRFNTYIKLMLYYDMVKNEKTSVNGYKGDIRDNVFTCRMQIRY
jgi:phosphate-selective porin